MSRGEKQKEDFQLCCGKYTLNLNRRTHIMGILNITPDSFYDGGRYRGVEQALRRAEEMLAQGADIIDVGGESSRPGSEEVSLAEETRRVIPVVERLVQEIDVPISIDTHKKEVARQALDLGVHIINDITALSEDSGLGRVIAEREAVVILMHMQGSPRDMQKNPHYQALIPEISSFFEKALKRAQVCGIKIEKILLDPGIGFGKKTKHNLEIIKNLRKFSALGRPLLLGPSRKKLIGEVLGLPAGERLLGTAATVSAAILNGAHILRVHDVREMVQVARMTDAICK